ncbi:MAG TPA: ABC transporter permease, partial [Vicinamibacterales bacterium]|nr:ABC transporter permease [Vicinamibacterales bacterium]
MIWHLAFRSLRRTPVSTSMAVLSLALGIGACTALYSILDSLLLRTLPVRDPARLVQAHNGGNNTSWTNLQWEQIRDREAVGEGAFAWSSGRFDLSGSGETDFVDGAYVSGGYFDALGVRPLLGRVLAGADDRRGGGAEGPAAVIGYGLWQRRYGASPDVIGRSITLGAVPFTIVGVMPPEFFGTEVGRQMDVAIPIGAEPLLRGEASGLDHRSYWWLSVMFRLRGDETLEQAEKRLRAVQPSIREATRPDDWPPDLLKEYLAEPFGLLPAASGESYLRERYRRPLLTLMIAVSLLLLVACANIANLMLARASGRRHELAVRAAMGGGRWALARPLLAESVLVAAAGAALGLAFAQWAGRALVAGLTNSSNRVFLDLSLNPSVLAFSLAATTLATIIFGTVPAFGAARARPAEALAERGRTVTGSGGRFTLSGLLVATQVALSLVLVVAAGLFGRSFAALTAMDLGFDRKPVLLVNVNAVRSATDLPGQTRLFASIREAALEVPGVQAAAVSVVTPASGRVWRVGGEGEGE